MSRKDTIDAMFGRSLGAPNTSPADRSDRVRTGAISAMGASLAQLTESAKTAARLQDQIASGASVLELDPADVDDSFVADRLAVENDPSFEALVASIAESGQQVPILVRPSLNTAGRFQVAYGHRRLRVAKRLRIKIKAVIRTLSDDELVVAQGKENLERRDLSFIERALFAKNLEDRSFERSVIVAALSCDKADVSRYLALARAIPADLAHAIGPAPRAGRSRWMALVEALNIDKAGKVLASVIKSAEFTSLNTDERFLAVLSALQSRPEGPRTPETWTARDGRRIARIERTPGRFVLAFDEKVAPAFGDYVLRELDTLLVAYEQSLESPSP